MTAWFCAAHHLWTTGDCPRCDDELIELADGGPHRVPESPTPRETALRALVSDWQANGNSRELGDPTDRVWFDCAQQLLAVLDAEDPR